MTEEFEVFYEAEFTLDRTDPEYLAQAAAEVQVGIRHLITAAAELEATIDPEKVFVEAIDRFDDGKLKRGLFIRAYVVRGSKGPEVFTARPLAPEDLEDAYVSVVSGPHLSKVREIMAAGAVSIGATGRKMLRPTLKKVAELVAAGKEAEAREYVAKVVAENKARWESGGR